MAKGNLQLAEGLVGGGVELEFLILPKEPRERAGDLGVAPDEAPIEVGEAEEHLEVADGGRLGPVDDGGNLLRIHLDTRG